jgi:hypothetical protein
MFHLPSIACEPQDKGTSTPLTVEIHEVASSNPHDHISAAIECTGAQETDSIFRRVQIAPWTYD